jgi:hypothetical protein
MGKVKEKIESKKPPTHYSWGTAILISHGLRPKITIATRPVHTGEKKTYFHSVK